MESLNIYINVGGSISCEVVPYSPVITEFYESFLSAFSIVFFVGSALSKLAKSSQPKRTTIYPYVFLRMQDLFKVHKCLKPRGRSFQLEIWAYKKTQLNIVGPPTSQTPGCSAWPVQFSEDCLPAGKLMGIVDMRLLFSS